ncbi:MAG TPA: hypothetical protein VM577_03065 [Anaerovoracaceae bacterium]|nr:hypothetical protein [Anaerovoracaceae bacterium]
MISEIINFAGPYRIANLKETRGMEGSGWYGMLFKGSFAIGEVADYGDGGPVHFRLLSTPNMEQELKAHAKEKCPMDPELKYDLSFETFLDYLANYQFAIKKLITKSKKKMLAVDEKCQKDSYGIHQNYYTYNIPYTEEQAKKVKAQNPQTIILNEELHKWEVPTVKARR